MGTMTHVFLLDPIIAEQCLALALQLKIKVPYSAGMREKAPFLPTSDSTLGIGSNPILNMTRSTQRFLLKKALVL